MDKKRTRFGPAGKPPAFRGEIEEVSEYLRKMGLDAFEYQAVRGVKISEQKARIFGEKATENDVWLTLHGPYFINLSGSDDVVKASKMRLIDSLKAANWMGAHQVVFHPGYYGSKAPNEALNQCIEALKDVIAQAKSFGIKVFLGPETTGKVSQLGSLDEIIKMCQRVEQTAPTIDWSHIHARGMGAIKTKEDYTKALDELEKELGVQTVKNLHCHYTRVEYSRSGEKRHHNMDEKNFGPEFKFFAQLIVELKLNPTIISETPLLDVDALKMKKILEEELKTILNQRK